MATTLRRGASKVTRRQRISVNCFEFPSLLNRPTSLFRAGVGHLRRRLRGFPAYSKVQLRICWVAVKPPVPRGEADVGGVAADDVGNIDREWVRPGCLGHQVSDREREGVPVIGDVGVHRMSPLCRLMPLPVRSIPPIGAAPSTKMPVESFEGSPGFWKRSNLTATLLPMPVSQQTAAWSQVRWGQHSES